VGERLSVYGGPVPASEPLAAAIDRLYAAFSGVRRPSVIEYCPCCFSAAPEIWRWSLPDLRLRSRQQVELSNTIAGALAVDGALLVLQGSATEEPELRYLAPGATTLSTPGSTRTPHGLLAAGA